MNFIYSKFLEKLVLQEVLLLPGAKPADEFKAALFTKAYVPNQLGAETYNDLVSLGFECKDPNAEAYAPENKAYQPGGKEVVFRLMSSDSTYTYLTCNNVSWSNATIKPRYAVIYRVSDGLLISCYDLGKNQDVENTRMAINWSGNAVLTIQTSLYYEQPSVNEISDISITTFGERPSGSGSGVKVTILLTNGLSREFYLYDGIIDNILNIESPNGVQNKVITEEFNRKIDSVAINDVPIIPIQTETAIGIGVYHNKINIEIEPIPETTIRSIVFGGEE